MYNNASHELKFNFGLMYILVFLNSEWNILTLKNFERFTCCKSIGISFKYVPVEIIQICTAFFSLSVLVDWRGFPWWWNLKLCISKIVVVVIENIRMVTQRGQWRIIFVSSCGQIGKRQIVLFMSQNMIKLT
jgi:hypothetical protein